MRVYYDNMIVSGLVAGDISPASEQAALQDIEAAHDAGVIKRVTSRESWREQARTRDAGRRVQLHEARDLVSVVQVDHRVLGSASLDSQFGTVSANPVVTDLVDGVLFTHLISLGLEAADARHFMYAAANSCDRFVTLDRHFLDRRTVLSERCPSLQVQTPSELAAEIRGGTQSRST